VSLAQQLTVDYNGFDATQFEQDLFSVPVEQEFQRQRKFAQQISDQGYPSLVLKYQDIFYPVVRDYLDANAALNDIENVLN
jgi:protein-disulfide isomerase-like protein with CxxC motif